METASFFEWWLVMFTLTMLQDTLSLVYFPKTYQINVKPIFIKSICTKGYSGKIFSKRMAVMLKPKIVLSIFLYIYKIKSFLNYTIKNG